jgi:hypothetical protein
MSSGTSVADRRAVSDVTSDGLRAPRRSLRDAGSHVDEVESAPASGATVRAPERPGATPPTSGSGCSGTDLDTELLARVFAS